MYQTVKHSLKSFFAEKAPRFLECVHTHKTIIKYFLSGVTAVLANLFVLYVLTDIFGVWYVVSGIAAFFVSISVGFSLQKFWTFRATGVRHIKRQMAMYMAVGAMNLALGPVMLYTIVETFGLWYVVAQVVVMALLAVGSYFINRFITFKQEVSYERTDVIN